MNNQNLESYAHRLTAHLLAAVAVMTVPAQTLAEPPTQDACHALAGTFVTSVSDIEGVFSSRGLATFTGDGVFLMTDSGQAGVPGIYEPFSTAQGAWQCVGAKGDTIEATATGLNFVFPGQGRTTSFGRTDYRLSLDTKTGVLSGAVELSFTSEGDLESADPVSMPGPVLEKFEIEGKRLVPKKNQAKSTERIDAAVHYDCGDGYLLSVTFPEGESEDASAQVRYPDGQLNLPRVRSGSGAKFADDDGTELWSKGNDALFTLADSEMKRCQKSD